MNDEVLHRRAFHCLKASRRAWERKSLAQQFALMSTAVLLIGMLTIGTWVANKIEASVTLNTALNTSLYIESFVAPLVQELADRDRLSAENQTRLNNLLDTTALGSRIESFKIWKPGGLIAYSSRPSIIGNVYPETHHLLEAWSGKVSAEFDELVDEEDAAERADGIAYLEMYNPVHDPATGRVIAVAEFYQSAEHFEHDLLQAQLESWLLVMLVTLVILGLLFMIVHRGSRTIEVQAATLKSRIRELSILRNRLKQASRRSTEHNEYYLRRIGADLHDGPAQLLALAALRLDAIDDMLVSKPDLAAEGRKDLDTVASALRDALSEVRQISSGLVLPELEHLTLSETLQRAVDSHETRTHQRTKLNLELMPARIGRPTQICLYRLVQEALNNAHRHAPGAPCSVDARYFDELIEVSVSDSGKGFDVESVELDSKSGLGLRGLRERIESLGGEFELVSVPGTGTRLTARFSITDLQATVE